MDRPKWPYSFSELIQVFAKVEGHNNPSSDIETPTIGKSKGDCILVHRAFLEKSSQFSRNTLSNSSWREGNEKRIDLIASKDVIEGFGNWPYRRRLDGNAPWQFWIDLYIFSCEYLITELSLDVLNEMLSKSEREPWIPDSEQIGDIYEHTAEGSSLRSLAVVCFSDNTENDRKTILQAADEARENAKSRSA
jgi:hypothetical protein